MTKRQNLVSGTFLCCLLFAPPLVAAEDGQAELDKAMELQLKATTVDELGEVASLCEKAIEKGLTPDDEEFATQLLTGALYKRTRPQTRLLVEATRLMPLNAELRERRKSLLADLQKILKYDETFGEAHLMIAQLQAIAADDRQQARKSIERAVELLEDDRNALIEALLVRGQLQETEEARLKDFNRAIELNPENPDVWKTRAAYFLKMGEIEKAIADFTTLLEKDQDNVLARMAIAESLMRLDKVDEAIEHMNQLIEDDSTAMALKLRARLWTVKGEFDQALKDIDQALELEPQDLQLFLMRARLYHLEGRNALAKTDVDRVLQANPDFPVALDLHSSIAATMGEFDEAVKDMNVLLEQDPENIRYKLQLAVYLNAMGNSRKAIEIFTAVLKAEPGNAVAIRGRADAYLSIGEHKKAIADYEAALKSTPDDSGVLNNFAWVLATSPDEPLRDGKRALELARKACELTEYEQAHILSTLAAAYAELGDFENAVKWSRKACEIGNEDVADQLKEELTSYQNGKPWRERKTQEETREEPAPDTTDTASGKDKMEERKAAEKAEKGERRSEEEKEKADAADG